ncbi:MAG: potassium transporter Kup, partial [Nitrosomonadales bacterium]|nr:potassium transporter Kup [Nitrosomonadales bacterium]
VMSVVAIFQSSSALANAYGIAITLDMVIATILAGFVMHEIWKWKWRYTLTFLAIFLTIDIIFFLSNIIKVPSGGWFPLLVGIIFVFLISTWKKGRKILFKKTKKETMEIDCFFKEMKNEMKKRVNGTAVFLTPNPDGVPHSLLHNLKHNKVLHKRIILLSIKFKDYPHANDKNIVSIKKLPNNFYKVILNYGYKDVTKVPQDLARYLKRTITLDPMDTSYFVGKENLVIRSSKDMNFFRKKIFSYQFRTSENITNQFNLPINRVVELGSKVVF